MPSVFREQREKFRADYNAAEPNAIRRRRTGLNGTAHAHYANERKFAAVREVARDMCRNDFAVDLVVRHPTPKLTNRQAEAQNGLFHAVPGLRKQHDVYGYLLDLIADAASSGAPSTPPRSHRPADAKGLRNASPFNSARVAP